MDHADLTKKYQITEKVLDFDLKWQQDRIQRYRGMFSMPIKYRLGQLTNEELTAILHVEERILIYLKIADMQVRDNEILPIHYEV